MTWIKDNQKYFFFSSLSYSKDQYSYPTCTVKITLRICSISVSGSNIEKLISLLVILGPSFISWYVCLKAIEVSLKAFCGKKYCNYLT